MFALSMNAEGKIEKEMDLNIELIRQEDIAPIIIMCAEIFDGHDTMARDPLMMEFLTQLDVSYKAVLGDELIGCYLMNEDTPYWDERYTVYEDLKPYRDKWGIHGLVLALRPEFRGRGYGRALMDLPRQMEYDYVWGYNGKSLDNIDRWMHYGRRIIAESEDCYITLMDLTA